MASRSSDLAKIFKGGSKIDNTSTTARDSNIASAIVARNASGNFSAGTITATLNGSASTVSNGAITTAKFATGAVDSNALGSLSVSSAKLQASIPDSKLATISTAGKVSNSATTATNLNTASAIVARDGSGNFTAGTITAALTGAASSNVLKAGDTMTGKLNTAGNDTARLIETLNTSASSAAQFYIEHNLGATNVGNARGVLNLVSTGALTIGGSVALTASNYNSYAPTLTGTGASGNWAINITGNAATVTNGALTTGTLAQFAATTSAQLLGVISDETGSGALVFGTAPTFTTTIDGGATFGAFASSTALTLGYTGTAASTINISTGATATATTKTVNLGTGGAAGSTTNINVGSNIAGTTAISSPTITMAGVVDTATTATHYYVETSGGNIAPKTLANARTELVTTAAVNAAGATTVGTVTSGTWSASFGAVSGANLTSLTAGNLAGTIPSAVLGNSTVNIGTTAVALNRASANLGLTGITSVAMPGATSGTITITPAATAGTTAITIPATTGTLVTTGDTGTVTSAMIANGTIVSGDFSSATSLIIYNSAGTAVKTIYSPGS